MADEEDGELPRVKRCRHESQKSEGGLAERHASVLLAKSTDELEAAYDAWATKYDEDLESLGGGENVAGLCCIRVLTQHTTAKVRPCLIDIGCGTGCAAHAIHDAGWRDFVGLDLSRGMLDVAEKRGLYSKCVQARLPDSGLQGESFDVVHACAIFAPGQAPPSAFDEFIRLLKPGGIAIFSVRQHYFDNEEGAEHKRRLQEIVDQGIWKQIAKTVEPYLPADNVNAYVFVMEKPVAKLRQIPRPAFVLNQAAVERFLPMAECIEHTAKALQLVQAKELLNPVRHGVILPLAEKEGAHVLGFMPCYLADKTTGDGGWWKPGPPGPEQKKGSGGYICSKIITVFPSNVGTGFSGHQGVVLLYSADNGSLLSIADAHEVTARRTAAASAAASRLLAKSGPCVLALLGSGAQAATHLEAMRCIREISAVHIWSRTKSRAMAFVDSAGIPVKVHDSAEDAVREADIVCTLTPSPAPILKYRWLKLGAHVNAVGSCNPLQQELDEECVTRGALFCDTKEGCLQGVTRTGDLVIPIEKGSLSPDTIVEVGEAMSKNWSRRNPDQITVFKSVGFAVEDLCSAVALYEKAKLEPPGVLPSL